MARAEDDNWTPEGYDREAADRRRHQLLARIAKNPKPTLGEIIAAEPDDEEPPTAEDIQELIRIIYEARDADLARRTGTDDS